MRTNEKKKFKGKKKMTTFLGSFQFFVINAQAVNMLFVLFYIFRVITTVSIKN